MSLPLTSTPFAPVILSVACGCEGRKHTVSCVLAHSNRSNEPSTGPETSAGSRENEKCRCSTNGPGETTDGGRSAEIKRNRGC